MGNSSLSCCSNNKLVQDQVCIDWSATGAVTETVYTNNITQDLYASGYVKYDIGVNPITVNFLVGTAIVNTITVQPQSSGSFTVRYFTTIQIVTTGTGTSQGQLCLTVRYPIS
ncbi:hypothetical protein ABH948_005436 [Bacillus sp. RC218]